MELPKFLLADNTDYPSSVFVVHTEFPRFILNLENDEVEWLEEFAADERKDLESETPQLIADAVAFYDREVARYED